MKKMKKLFYGISLLTLIGVMFISCQNEDLKPLDENVVVGEITFLEIPNNKSEKNKILNVEDYLEYVYFDGVKSIQFMNENGVDTNSFIAYLTDKIEEMDNYNTNLASKCPWCVLEEEPLSDEEIRNAMISECQNGYCCGLAYACEVAVKIAYHLR